MFGHEFTAGALEGAFAGCDYGQLQSLHEGLDAILYQIEFRMGPLTWIPPGETDKPIVYLKSKDDCAFLAGVEWKK